MKDGYYKSYLEVIKEIINANNPKIASKVVLNSIKKDEMKDNNIDSIKKRLLKEIVTANTR